MFMYSVDLLHAENGRRRLLCICVWCPWYAALLSPATWFRDQFQRTTGRWSPAVACCLWSLLMRRERRRMVIAAAVSTMPVREQSSEYGTSPSLRYVELVIGQHLPDPTGWLC